MDDSKLQSSTPVTTASAKPSHVKTRLSLAKQPLFSVLNDHLVDYPTPSNITYF
jgi:hypothetical protein